MKSVMFVRALAALCLLGALAACGGNDAPPAGSASCKTATPGLRCAP